MFDRDHLGLPSLLVEQVKEITPEQPLTEAADILLEGEGVKRFDVRVAERVVEFTYKGELRVVSIDAFIGAYDDLDRNPTTVSVLARIMNMSEAKFRELDGQGSSAGSTLKNLWLALKNKYAKDDLDGANYVFHDYFYPQQRNQLANKFNVSTIREFWEKHEKGEIQLKDGVFQHPASSSGTNQFQRNIATENKSADKTSRIVQKINKSSVLKGDLYADKSRITRGALSRIISAVLRRNEYGSVGENKKGFYGILTYKAYFIMGYQLKGAGSLVYEIWFDSRSSSFLLKDARGNDMNKPMATMSEAVSTMFRFIRQNDEHNDAVTMNSRGGETLMKSMSSALAVDDQRVRNFAKKEEQKEERKLQKTKEERNKQAEKSKQAVARARVDSTDGVDVERAGGVNIPRFDFKGFGAKVSGAGNSVLSELSRMMDDLKKVRPEEREDIWRTVEGEIVEEDVGHHEDDRKSDPVDDIRKNAPIVAVTVYRDSVGVIYHKLDPSVGASSNQPLLGSSTPTVSRRPDLENIHEMLEAVEAYNRRLVELYSARINENKKAVAVMDAVRKSNAPKSLDTRFKDRSRKLEQQIAKDEEAKKRSEEHLKHVGRLIDVLRKSVEKNVAALSGSIEPKPTTAKALIAPRVNNKDYVKSIDQVDQIEAKAVATAREFSNSEIDRIDSEMKEILDDLRDDDHFGQSGFDDWGDDDFSGIMDSENYTPDKSQTALFEMSTRYSSQEDSDLVDLDTREGKAILRQHDNDAAMIRSSAAQLDIEDTHAIGDFMMSRIERYDDQSRFGAFSRHWYTRMLRRMATLSGEIRTPWTENPTGWFRVLRRTKLYITGRAYRADFIEGYSLDGRVNIEIWYIVEPNPRYNRKTRNVQQPTISSFYVFDATSEKVVREYLPYHRNARQVVLQKLGVINI